MDIDEGSYEENMAKLDEQFKKPKANPKNLRGIMKSTFEGIASVILCYQVVYIKYFFVCRT